jgi:hypothetical protein
MAQMMYIMILARAMIFLNRNHEKQTAFSAWIYGRLKAAAAER